MRVAAKNSNSMKLIADFHIHSRYSRATSSAITLEALEQGAHRKGIKVLGTGDCTHPLWMKEMETKLEQTDSGFYLLRDSLLEPEKQVHFAVTGEISCIYSKGGKVRKVHIVVIFPDIAAAKKFNEKLGKFNLHSDGRPILGLDTKELLKIFLDCAPQGLFVPGHCFTPWFSVFGSKSGFDSLQECFEELTPEIYALETGLSADPAMVWRTSDGSRLSLLSNSDAHSIQKLGREANVFACDLDYTSIVEAIKKRDNSQFLNTIEFFPQEGKYYNDGHANCQISFDPKETARYNGLCPVCGQKLTIGVLSRVEQIAQYPSGFRPEGAIGFKHIVPLEEIIAYVFGVGPTSRKVKEQYEKLVPNVASEFELLLETPIADIARCSDEQIATAVELVRLDKVKMEAGYDGVYGKLKGLEAAHRKEKKQSKLI